MMHLALGVEVYGYRHQQQPSTKASPKHQFCSTSSGLIAYLTPLCWTKIIMVQSQILNLNWLVSFITWTVLHSALMFMSTPFSSKATTLPPPFGSKNPVHPPTLPLPTSSGCLASTNDTIDMSHNLITSLVDLLWLQMPFHMIFPSHGVNSCHPLPLFSPS